MKKNLLPSVITSANYTEAIGCESLSAKAAYCDTCGEEWEPVEANLICWCCCRGAPDAMTRQAALALQASRL